MEITKNLTELLELANHYPSPHNGQPIVLKYDSQKLSLFFEKDRGLQATEISFLFSFVSMGVFTKHLKFCAQALGHTLNVSLKLPEEQDLKGTGHIKFAEAAIKWSTSPKDAEMIKTLESRQTSRKKYTSGISTEVKNELVSIAQKHKMKLVPLSQKQAHETIWLNQRAVFDDLFDEPVRQELDHWLRYSNKQKISKKDGLSYDCMELNGAMLKYIVHHPSFLRWPVLSSLLRHYYLRTMRDSSSVFYLQAPFSSEQNSFDIGEAVMEIWIACSRNKYYIHPFGTIVTNHKAHTDFVKLAGVTDESRESGYISFIFRAGMSEKPIRSERITASDHLIQELHV